jgi:hypothetical protein
MHHQFLNRPRYVIFSDVNCADNDYKGSTLCFRLFREEVTWFAALSTCENLGYTLATPDLQTFTIVAQHDNISGSIWTDLHRYPWEWSTGETQRRHHIFTTYTVQ